MTQIGSLQSATVERFTSEESSLIRAPANVIESKGRLAACGVAATLPPRRCSSRTILTVNRGSAGPFQSNPGGMNHVQETEGHSHRSEWWRCFLCAIQWQAGSRLSPFRLG